MLNSPNKLAISFVASFLKGKYRFLLLFLVVLVYACSEPYTARPKGYFKINFPERAYQSFVQPDYPYTFEYPQYAQVVKDTNFFEEKAGDYWINIEFPEFNGKIYISYKSITSPEVYDQLVTDAFNLAYKQHTMKASAIKDSIMEDLPSGGGVFFKLMGNTATGRQFFLTDSTKHFLRGALYFDASPNEDSLGIVQRFLEQDMKHLLKTLRWTKD